MLRVTTLKPRGTGVATVIDYYAGLAEDQQCRDGRSRGPVDYYLDPDEPPGRWWGSGLGAVGLAGEVEAEQLRAMLDARHPDSGRPLGRGFGISSARGFDATFSAPKSVSVLWALSPDPFVRAEVLAAHDAAVTSALGWFERHGAVTRRGSDGVDQVDTKSLVVALFRQHTSRSIDPQLHTHALVWSKVQDRSGRWLSLDARFLKYQQRTIGWIYDAALRAELTARLGVGWEPCVEGHTDIAGIGPSSARCSPSAPSRCASATPPTSAAGWQNTTARIHPRAPSPASSAGPSSTVGPPRPTAQTPTACTPSGWPRRARSASTYAGSLAASSSGDGR